MADRVDVAQMARELIALHLDASWQFAFDRAKRRSGACHFRQGEHDGRITLSGPITDSATFDDMRQVMLHEIAHALVGPRHGHDRYWRSTARAIGYDGRRLSSTDVDERYAPYVGTCPAGHEVYRYRVPNRPMSCARCSTVYDPKFKITFYRRTR